MNFLEKRIPPPLVLLLFLVLTALFRDALPRIEAAVMLRQLASGSLFVLGLIVALAGVREFKRSATTVNPLKPEAASTLVQSGVYQWTRNPMYLGMVCWLLALGCYLGTFVVLITTGLFIWFLTRFQILPEERALADLFGREFETYTQSVRRWL